ncbi:MAG TPA: VOC family protein [Paracoccaceae bacterium]|nr:VOC family protein [Paracoccaceae bacterium]
MIDKLMVADMSRSLDFYCGGLGFQVQFGVSSDHEIKWSGNMSTAMFCSLAAGRLQLMLQTAASMAEELPALAAEERRGGSFTLYYSGITPERALERLGGSAVRIRGPETTWYGMRELHLRDPDGYVVCVAAPVAVEQAVRSAA